MRVAIEQRTILLIKDNTDYEELTIRALNSNNVLTEVGVVPDVS